MRKILLVEDEPLLREVYGVVLSTEAYFIHVAANGQEALECCAQNEYDLILLDLMMPVLDGIGFLKEFNPEDHPSTKVLMLSNLSAGKELAEAVQYGAHRTILKSDLSPRQLLATVRYELEA